MMGKPPHFGLFPGGKFWLGGLGIQIHNQSSGLTSYFGLILAMLGLMIPYDSLTGIILSFFHLSDIVQI